MAFIDLLINETTEKFGLEQHGIAIISALVSRMNQQTSGGIDGFLNIFRQACLTEHVNDWLQNESKATLTPQQLASALEPETLQQLAQKAGLPLEKTSEVVAYLVPLLIGHLAARNAVFSSQPDEIRQALWSDQIVRQPEIAAASAQSPAFSLLQLAASAKLRGVRLLRAISFL